MPDMVGDISGLGILFALLPGLLTYLVTHFLTARHEEIEWTKAALLGLGYTLIAHATWSLLKLPGDVVPTPDLIGLTLTGVAWGLGISFVATRGWLYTALRHAGFTNQPSWPTIWRTTFSEYRNLSGEFVVLHLRDGRRIFGSLFGVSPTQRDGHIYLKPAVWLTEGVDRDGHQVLLSLQQDRGFLFNAEDVHFVEFVPPRSA